MLSFFRRKKPQDAPAAEAPKTQHYSAEELAAAFPSAAPVEDREPAPVAAPAAPAPVEPPPAAVAPVTVEPTPVAPAPVVPAVPAPIAPAPIAQIDVAPVVAPAIEPVPAPLPEPAPTPAPVSDDLPAAASIDAVPAPAGKPGWRERLRNSVIARSFGGLFSRNPKLDDDLLDELETALITADVGVGATTDLVEGLRKRMKSREFADANALLAALRAELIAILQPVAKPLVIDRNAKPFVVLTVGVNGVGKTTTIGKLAKRFKDDGHSLMLAAGDTFRAAAVAQLQAWGERNGVAVVAQGQNADAASVAFDALQAGKARGTSVLIADTAGRLHTQSGLMNELGKIRRVLGKIDPTAPHEVLMVIDGTTGQNALSQLRQFNAAVNVTGLVVTKLDGTAKGGVVFALAREFGIPIRFAGIGERPEDLRVFDPEAFVDALLPEALGA
ncbi:MULTISPECIES: signal recognition particle-docking protein FtsY [Stenotrophomonas]|uniref:signal recognition particle-docking protein FtsY n=1 Tax=Stenotrophomonas TaxID=40323 RepID=UPI0008DC6E6E|nr:signal recognition particle-docking protein FtsY [Stenotrophomonas maltophilia]OHY62862.1 signal recognition particle-docking protein FtsY [Stenotrophomonas maltophilia]HEL4847707.1 signal recognition particle-docking protein FtsY [Stenotrophomonas maltophilia]